MRIIAGPLNGNLLENLLHEVLDDCSIVRAAVAYAQNDNMLLFNACADHHKPIEFFGRYDHTVPVSPEILKWFLDKASPNFVCKLVPDILHAKIIWWVGAGVYIGSANLSDRAWRSNIELGVFLSQSDIDDQQFDRELISIFDQIDVRSRPLDKKIYEEQCALKAARQTLAEQDYAREAAFAKKRLLPVQPGLLTVFSGPNGKNRQFIAFEKEWNSTLQIMHDMAKRVSDPAIRPAWIKDDVPAGIQADQFLHAYYYNIVKPTGKDAYEAFYNKHRNDPESALRDALLWWRRSDFDHRFEERTIYEWAPKIRKAFAVPHIQALTKDEFVEAISCVHAVIEHGLKQKNEMLGLPNTRQDNELKVPRFAEWLWGQKSKSGKSIITTIDYIVWGGGPITSRIYNAMTSDDWRIPHFNISSIGEVVGWSNPDNYPPRNQRTNKGLKALGYRVKV